MIISKRHTPNRFSFASLVRFTSCIMRGLHLSMYMNMFIDFILLSLAYKLHVHVIQIWCVFS